MIISRSIHVAANGIISFFFMLSSIPFFFIHSSIHGHIDCFHILATVNNVSVNIGVHIFLSYYFVSFRYICRSGITELYGSSSFNFLRNLYTFFHNGCTSLYSDQQHMGVPFSLHPRQHLLFFVFLVIAILTDVR